MTALVAVMAAATGMLSAVASGSELPDGRRYEMVSPAAKNGGDVIPESQRTRAAADGSAVGFISLAGFGDVQGTGLAVDYMSVRSSSAAPGTNGWATHSTTPPQPDQIPLPAVLGQLETVYDGEFSTDLGKGVVMAYSPVTDDPMVKDVVNLYRRSDLRTPGAGAYELLTSCALCTGTNDPLPPLPNRFTVAVLRPYLAGSSPDMSHVVFESRFNLTTDAPPQPPACDPLTDVDSCRSRVYEWDDGTLRLAGILPDGTPADGSIAGEGVGSNHSRTRAPHVVSDGSDGHTRVFFTQPTDDDGRSSEEADPGAQGTINASFSGDLFMRVDGRETEQLNLSERSAPGAYARATYLDASTDGRRVFFMTAQQLTDDEGGQSKIYMYDASKPGTDPGNLTVLTPDPDPLSGDVPDAVGVIGTSADGRYVYMVARGQLVAGEDPLGNTPGIYLWHDGEIRLIGTVPDGLALGELLGTAGYIGFPQQARVTPDGRHMLMSATDSSGLTLDDHGTCISSLGSGCRELYVYSADTDQLVCASCRSDRRVSPTQHATTVVREDNGATQTSWHLNRPLSDDGSRVFFSTAEALVPEDSNGKVDAYMYDVPRGRVSLLSSGTDPADSWFLDASSSGKDVFFTTREQLVGWDRDRSYDLYDARVGGGFPEPPPTPPGCSGDACQPDSAGSPAQPLVATQQFRGDGDVKDRVRARRAARRCRRGFVKKRVRGKTKCVKRARGRRAARKAKRAHGKRRGS